MEIKFHYLKIYFLSLKIVFELVLIYFFPQYKISFLL